MEVEAIIVELRDMVVYGVEIPGTEERTRMAGNEQTIKLLT